MNVLVFDIETIPDLTQAQRIHHWQHLNETEVVAALLAHTRAKTGGQEFVPLYLQKIVAISLVLRQNEQLAVWSLGDLQSTEAELITRFFQGIGKYVPTLVSWNGSGFDCPVLNYRSLLHGISAPEYWDMGEYNSQFKYNNYQNRYHMRHLDLMDVLAAYQARANAPLDAIATMLGFPGKMGMSGDKVFSAYKTGDLESIRRYCETDVLNTFLVYLRFELMRGNLDSVQYENELARVREMLKNSNEIHLTEFLEKWGA